MLWCIWIPLKFLCFDMHYQNLYLFYVKIFNTISSLDSWVRIQAPYTKTRKARTATLQNHHMSSGPCGCLSSIKEGVRSQGTRHGYFLITEGENPHLIIKLSSQCLLSNITPNKYNGLLLLFLNSHWNFVRQPWKIKNSSNKTTTTTTTKQ